MNRGRVILFVFLCGLFFFSASVLRAQNYNMEIGLNGGTNSYLGGTNPNSLVKDFGYSAGAMVRYNIDFKSVLKLTANYNGVSIKDYRSQPTLPDRMQEMWDVAFQYELNFNQFGNDDYAYRSVRRLSPYFGAGVGVGGWQGVNGATVSFVFPISLGLKYKVTERLNIGAELTAKWIADDSFDGMVYSNSDWYKNKDWLFGFSFFVTFDLWTRREEGMNLDVVNRLRKSKRPFYQE